MIPDVRAFSMPPRITSLTGQLYRTTEPCGLDMTAESVRRRVTGVVVALDR
jgi:hypothetical protein